MRLLITYTLLVLLLSNCSVVGTYHQNSVNTPCFNNTNNYQIRAGYGNKNYLAQIAAKPYKNFSFLLNTSFSDFQNNSDFSLGYTQFGLFNSNLGIEGFLGGGFGNTNHKFEKNTFHLLWDYWYTNNYDITNKFYKFCPQLHIYYSFENNIQLALFTRISEIHFNEYNIESGITDSTVFFNKHITNLKVRVLDIGMTLKYEIKHVGFFLQATYTSNNSKVILPSDIRFQRKFPVYLGLGINLYWNSFSRKITPTPKAH